MAATRKSSRIASKPKSSEDEEDLSHFQRKKLKQTKDVVLEVEQEIRSSVLKEKEKIVREEKEAERLEAQIQSAKSPRQKSRKEKEEKEERKSKKILAAYSPGSGVGYDSE